MKKFQALLVFSLFIALHSTSFAQAQPITEKVRIELDEAEKKMFDGIMQADYNYWKNYVHPEYITINADGVKQTRAEAIADSAKYKQLFQNSTYKLLDRTVRVYGHVGIVTGKVQGYYGSQMVAEVYYTEIWTRENGTWLFTGWQGTPTKNSPPPPKQ